MRRRLVAAAIGAALSAGVPHAVTAQDHRPVDRAAAQLALANAFVGRWTLDTARTIAPDPRDRLATGGSASDAMAITALLRPPTTLVISAADLTITITPDPGVPESVFPDDRPVTDTLLDGQERVIRARWEKDRLVVERRLTGVARVRESYRIDSGKALIVDLELDSDNFSGKFEEKLIYRSTGRPR